MRARHWLFLAAVLTAGCDSPMIPGRDTADIYAFELETKPPLVMRWPAGHTIRVLVNPSTDAGRTALLDAAFGAAASAWNGVTVFGEYRIAQTSEPAAADVVLTWSDVLPPVTTADCPPAITRAVTTFCIDGLGTAEPRLRVFPLREANAASTGRVKMLVTVLAAEAANPTTVRRLVAHELGHVLGIGQHSGDPRDLMWRTDPALSGPGRRDIATVLVLYHVRHDVVP